MSGTDDLLRSGEQLQRSIRRVGNTIAKVSITKKAQNEAEKLKADFDMDSKTLEDERQATIDDMNGVDKKALTEEQRGGLELQLAEFKSSSSANALKLRSDFQSDMNAVKTGYMSGLVKFTGMSAGAVKVAGEGIFPSPRPVGSVFSERVRAQESLGKTRAEAVEIASRQEQSDALARAEASAQIKVGTTLGKEARAGRRTFVKDFDKSIQQQSSTFDRLATTNKRRIGFAKSAVELLESDNPVAPKAIGTLMARASGEVGNLAQNEQQNFSGSQSLVGKISRQIGIITESKIPEADKKSLIELANIYIRSAREEGNTLADDLSTRVERRFRGKQFSGELDLRLDSIREKITGQVRRAQELTPKQKKLRALNAQRDSLRRRQARGK